MSSFKSWFFLGLSFGYVKANWHNVRDKLRCSASEKKLFDDTIEEIENNMLEDMWKEQNSEHCIHAIQELVTDLINLYKKYNDDKQ